jgi:glycyl-tRNA synthetase beta chain
MSKYLLEIGTEELPFRFILQAIEQLKQNFEIFFKENKIKFNSINVLATPRRLAVVVDEIDFKQADEEKILKGPIKNIAYDVNGNLSKAGFGFANKCGVEENELFLKEDYLHAKIQSKGKLTSELLQSNVAQIVLKLQGSHFMRWAENDEKFSRPIRWIVSILDDKELPIQIVDIKSSNFSRGHRFSEKKEIEINNVDEYVEKLRKMHIIVNQEERRQKIEKDVAKLGNKVIVEQDLLDEVTYLCEYPVACVCEFDEKYLVLPEKVIVTVMAKHQRYFPIYENGKLTNKFITVTNYLGDDFSNIKAGNERVVTARFEDAIFFFKEDTKKTFESYVENLKGVTFQKGMGSVWDKTQRIITLSQTIADTLDCTKEQKKSIERTALLCKADLTTNLVFEFTELQGFIGADYARHSKEDESVCKGIEEHYFPLGADEVLAEFIEGQVVGIADKLDTICAVFVGGKIPTGSSDPLGVRRATLGIMKTLWQTNILNTNISLSKLIKKTLELLPQKADVQKQIEDFFIQRLIIFGSETNRRDIIEACCVISPLENFSDFIDRLTLLNNVINTSDFNSVFECANRISRILKEDINVKVNENLLQLQAEIELYEKIKDLNLKNKAYNELYKELVDINPVIENFFEKVLVMDKDEKIKQNRLAMLNILKQKYDLIADFSSLQR